ncbi:hypothetical protein ABLE68_08655 [Nocardioides sp. CN2-186]|uniref:hypothetical protein n=1 Tax=Nocardioides tweenelious TaxID=3156607 RepID=UPI0032B4F697
MKPLQAAAMGLVIVALNAKVNGYDLLADPLGWLLVLHGVRLLPAEVPRRDTIHAIGIVAALVSVALWFPAFTDALSDTDDSLVWAATLPQIAFVALLCAELAAHAGEAGDAKAARWLRVARTLTIAVGVLPIVVYPIESDLLVPLILVAVVTIVLVIVLLFSYSSRPWALHEEPAGNGDRGRSS